MFRKIPFPILLFALLVSACRPAPAGDAPVATSEVTVTSQVTVTSEPTPAATATLTSTPTETSFPKLELDYSSKESLQASVDKFASENLYYWETGDWGTEAKQKEMSAVLSRLYTQILADSGWQKSDIEALNPYELMFNAQKAANQKEVVLPADLDIARQMRLGPQGVAYKDANGNFVEGIGIVTMNDFSTQKGLESFTNEYDGFFRSSFTVDTFGISTTIDHKNYDSMLTHRAAVVQYGKGIYGLITYYENIDPIKQTSLECYLPLRVYFEPTQASKNLGALLDSNNQYIGWGLTENINNVEPQVQSRGGRNPNENPHTLETLISLVNSGNYFDVRDMPQGGGSAIDDKTGLQLAAVVIDLNMQPQVSK